MRTGRVKHSRSAAGFCAKCHKNTKHVTRTGNKSPWCRECINTAGKDYRASHLEQTRKWSRESSRYRKYGLAPAALEELLREQGNRCAICGVGLSTEPHSRPILHVDHDHTDNAVRGLLCHECNVCIGMARDSISILESAIGYLRKYNGR